jgi:HSP20 family molecular chaperone IbpA
MDGEEEENRKYKDRSSCGKSYEKSIPFASLSEKDSLTARTV